MMRCDCSGGVKVMCLVGAAWSGLGCQDGEPVNPPDGRPIVLTGPEIIATAPAGIGHLTLGMPVDENFNQIGGESLFETAPQSSPQNAFQFQWVKAESSRELAANFRGWQLTGDFDLNTSTRYMSMRANQTDYYEEVDLAKPAATAPNGAVYFVWKIYYGHSYEALFSADQTVFTSGVAAQLALAQGSISAKATELNLQQTNVGRGLVPNSGTAIFAQDAAEVQANYSASPDSAVPIFVGYRLVPNAVLPEAAPIPWQGAIHPTLRITEIDVFHNGAVLDASNTAWDLWATCRLGGAVLVDGEAVWSHPEVSAGGSDVNPDGVTPPQDPNVNDPTTTYGRNAGLSWSHTFSVASQNVISCVIEGERNDVDPAVPLPPVLIEFAVDETQPIAAGIAGNYDVGTNLDYAVQYSVSY